MKLCRRGLHEYEGQRCRECKNAHAAKMYRVNPERAKERAASRRRRSPERVASEVAAWHKANPNRVREIKSAWKKKHPESRRKDNYIRRSRLIGARYEPVTEEHLSLLLEAQDGCCRYCRMPLGEDKHLDHRVPLSRGGAHAPSNVCWSCPGCNLRKSKKTESEFLAVNPSKGA